MENTQRTIEFIKEKFGTGRFIPLHEPCLIGKEKEYLAGCIDSTFVSYLGEYVTQFEKMITEYTGAKYALAMSNGTSALHIALVGIGVESGDEVITQALTFVATANAISYCGAKPIFLDSDLSTWGLSAAKLEKFLSTNTEVKDGFCYNKKTGKKISACIPMHVFGHPVEIDSIVEICSKYNIPVVEDSAESLGSKYKGRHTGTFGKVGIFSLNGNKIVTCGGGGVVITDDESLAEKIKHLSTTAKVPHKWEYVHDEIGYNYRLANVNAAVACAQMELLPQFLENKRELASEYYDFFKDLGIKFKYEDESSESNYWLNAIVLNDFEEREYYLKELNGNNVMARPVWRLLNKLRPFCDCETDDLENASWLEERVVNIPSSVRLK